jgi:hypothetical protein
VSAAPPAGGTGAGEAGASAHFVSKWLERNPEMHFARLFCAADARARFDAWGALLHEVGDGRFALREPSVFAAKTAWWAEELRALAAGTPRHPLGRDLLGAGLPGNRAPWLPLARALLGGADAADGLPADREASLARLASLAEAAANVEGALFGASPVGGAAAARSLAVHWRLHALPRGLAGEDAAGLPMALLARHGLTRAGLADALPGMLLRDWANELAGALPGAAPGAALPTQARLRFDRRRLARLAAAGDRFDAGSPPMLLLAAWRAGRDAARAHRIEAAAA